MNLTVAIDYTASNEEYELHEGENNSYVQAIQNVGQVVEPYDYDKLFPVFGFGGIDKFNGNNQVSHCFPLNGYQNPSVFGVAGIIDVYRKTLPNIKFSGPTKFINNVQQ